MNFIERLIELERYDILDELFEYIIDRKINKYIKWKPKFNNLDYILKTAYEWEKKLSLTF